MEDTEQITPKDILDKAIVASAHLRNYMKVISRLSPMLEYILHESNRPSYAYGDVAIRVHDAAIGKILAELAKIEAIAEGDIEQGVEFYEPREMRELTQEELQNMTEEDMPY